MIPRPEKDVYFAALAKIVSSRATCLRRKVGCVLINSRGHILSTGYNGRASGLPHCADTGGEKDYACPGMHQKSGINLDVCEAIHAEQNALLQCHDVYQIDTCYVTVSPCITCAKLLLNTSCQRIVFGEVYPHTQACKLWEGAGKIWTHLQQKDQLPC